jgi:hypothetical protein
MQLQLLAVMAGWCLTSSAEAVAVSLGVGPFHKALALLVQEVALVAMVVTRAMDTLFQVQVQVNLESLAVVEVEAKVALQTTGVYLAVLV